MKSRIAIIIATVFVCAVAVLGIFAFMRQPQPARPAAHNKLQVTATFYPMAEFARQVGGNLVQVSTLVKPGVEPHDYDPAPQAVAGIYTSDVLVYNGADLERWVGKLQSGLQKHDVTVVRASAGIPLRAADASDADAVGGADPHVWMNPALAITEVDNIRSGLTKADPANANVYATNAAAYTMQLQALDTAFAAGLASCQVRTIITSHQAFSYLAAQYNLRAVGIAGLSPDDEPSPQKLAQVATLARQNHVDYIFFEELVSPKLSQTIATEVGAKTIAFNPLEGLSTQEIRSGQNYLTVQQANLQALRTALHCK